MVLYASFFGPGVVDAPTGAVGTLFRCFRCRRGSRFLGPWTRRRVLVFLRPTVDTSLGPGQEKGLFVCFWRGCSRERTSGIVSTILAGGHERGERHKIQVYDCRMGGTNSDRFPNRPLRSAGQQRLGWRKRQKGHDWSGRITLLLVHGRELFMGTFGPMSAPKSPIWEHRMSLDSLWRRSFEGRWEWDECRM